VRAIAIDAVGKRWFNKKVRRSKVKSLSLIGFVTAALMVFYTNCSSNFAATTNAGSTQTPTLPIGSGAVLSNSFVFSPYKDVGINLNWNSNLISSQVSGSAKSLIQSMPGNLSTVTLAFATGECGAEVWAGIPGDTLAQANIAPLVSAGKKYVISTGGAAGVFTCSTDSGFQTFLQRYNSVGLIGIDFDIEAGQTQTQIDQLVQRVISAKKNFPSLRFSFTLASLAPNLGASVATELGSGQAPNPLGTMGQMVMDSIQKYGLTNFTINLMVMDYGSPSPNVCVVSGGSCEMGQSAIQAAMNLKDYYNLSYQQIELTPMIGGNDVAGEVFTIADVQIVTQFALANHLGGLHFWSFDRDTDCSLAYASPTCNSYNSAGTLGFTNAFLTGLGY
jgi:chitinase